MSTSTTAASSGPAVGARGARSNDGVDWKWQIGKAALFYFAFQGVAGPNGLVAWYTGKTSSPKGAAQFGNRGPLSSSNQQNTQSPFSVPNVAPPRIASNASTKALFRPDEKMDMYVFVTTARPPTIEDLSTQASTLVPNSKGPRSEGAIDYPELLEGPVWKSSHDGDQVLAAARLQDVTLNDASLSRSIDLSVDVPLQVQNSNHSIWADVYACPKGIAPGNQRSCAKIRKLLTLLHPQRREREVKKLFVKSKDEPKEEIKATTSAVKKAPVIPFLDKEVMPIIPYWHNNLTIALVSQDPGSGYPIGGLPPPVLQWVHVVEDDQGEIVKTADHQLALNYPIIFVNSFWQLREHMYPINSTVTTLPLHVNVYSTTFFKFQMLSALGDSFDKQPGMASGELDIIKLTLLETAPWYLILTVAVSILHSIFEMLAFTSDVSHWRKKENMAGVSLGTILTNVFVQLIILLYLLDQKQDTSTMIIASSGIGMLIEAWKITKAVSVSIQPRKKGEGLKYLQWSPYRVEIKDRHVLSEEEKKTQEYDKLAFRIVSYFAAPLLGGYTIYSALYQEHKGTWSFIIGTLTSFVYAFGFVSMIPQLIVNYKLKSVAGLNPKTFIFKILSTVVDDFFSFAIRMPLLHRLACFRDDVIFLIFLYQRWLYGVDNTRRNEFGQVVEEVKGGEIEETKKTQ